MTGIPDWGIGRYKDPRGGNSLLSWNGMLAQIRFLHFSVRLRWGVFLRLRLKLRSCLLPNHSSPQDLPGGPTSDQDAGAEKDVEGWSLSKKLDISFAGSLNLVVVLNKIDGLNNFGGLAKQRQGIKMKRISMTYEPVSKALSLVKVVVRILPRCPCSPKIGE